jgi:hypothetical protein
MPLLTEAAERQQKDYLCGPFHAARVLSDLGVDVDQDAVALRAGTSLPLGDEGEVPPGAMSKQDYRCQLPRVEPEQAGTSAQGLATAIQELSAGQLVCVPLSGQWTASAVEGLFESDARLIANLQTGLLWGSHPSADTLLAALDGNLPSEPPPADWDVGHFVELLGLARGRGGSLVMVRDSYPTLGYEGVHLQPPVTLASALNRYDGRQGGVLAVAEAQHEDAARRLASELGLKTEMWDN